MSIVLNPNLDKSLYDEAKSLLEGFSFVESDGRPSITLDKSRRFYLNTAAQKLLRAKPFYTMSISYNVIDRALAVITNSDLAINDEVHTSWYNVDKRFYMSARHFANEYAFNPENAPFHFDYTKGSDKSGIFIFKMRPMGR